MRALVTGCSGFIGSHLTEALLADGHSVIGLDSFNDNYGRPQKERNLETARDRETFELRELDLNDGDLGALVTQCDVIFHLAAEPGVRTSWGPTFDRYVRNNVLGTQKLLETVKAWPEKRVVYASSSSVYGQAEMLPTPEDTNPRPNSPYGVTKLAAEHLCRLYSSNYGVETVSLRYFSVFGPRQRPDMAFNRFCRAALEGRKIEVYGDGTQTRDFTFVADVIRATRSAASTPLVSGAIYNVGGGSRVSLEQALALIGEFADKPLDLERLDRQYGDVQDTGADIRRAREDLGYEPSTEFADGLRAEFEWIRENMDVFQDES